MRNPLLVSALAALPVLAAACSSSAGSDFVEGNLYWAPADGGGIAVFKLLVADDEGVHLRVYSNAFDAPPSAVDESTLYVAEDFPPPGDRPGLEHTFVAWDWFDTWETGFVQQSLVQDEELDGYRRWLIDRSPAFSGPDSDDDAPTPAPAAEPNGDAPSNADPESDAGTDDDFEPDSG